MNHTSETTVASHFARIYIAGYVPKAEQICREFCMEVGECVTVTPTNFIYKGGEECGVVVGFINYPRFPRIPEEIDHRAMVLADRLMVGLCQSSYTIETPVGTTWFSRRER